MKARKKETILLPLNNDERVGWRIRCAVAAACKPHIAPFTPTQPLAPVTSCHLLARLVRF